MTNCKKDNLYKKFIVENIRLDDLNLTIESVESLFRNQKFIEECFLRAEKLTIGTAMLVKNQEVKVKKAIQDASTISDKIVVCDTGSTDGTLNTLENFSLEIPLEIKKLDWEENYGKMRNQASSFLDTDWIFIIDSDESLEVEINSKYLKFCLSFLEKTAEGADLVLSFRQKAISNSAVGYPQRLYKNNKRLQFWGYVHEELRSPRIINIMTKLALFNQGTSELEVEKFNKEERYNKLLLKNIEEEPYNSKWISLLSNQWISNNLNISYNMVVKLIDIIKQEEKSHNYFDMNLFTSYILILIGKNVNKTEILKEIQIAKKIFSNNPVFFYFEHAIKLLEINNLIHKQINQLREDVNNIKNETDSNIDWFIHYPIENLECIMIKLLMKFEKYHMAHDMYLRNRQTLQDTHLIVPEVNFFESITNKPPF